MSLLSHNPRQRFMAQERRAPVVAREVLGLPHFAVLRRCPKCEQWLPEDSEHFHRDDTCKSGWAASCKACRNKRDRDRYHDMTARKRKSKTSSLWCPHCEQGVDTSVDDKTCEQCGCRVNNVETTGRMVVAQWPAARLNVPNSVLLDITTDIGFGRHRYLSVMVMSSSIYKESIVDLDEIEYVKKQLGDCWIPVFNEDTQMAMHRLMSRAWHYHQGGKL